jgi:hypothetical protein
VRAEVRKAAVQRRPELTARELPNFGQLKQAEKGLIWALIHDPENGMAALNELQDNDLEGLIARSVLEEARKLSDQPAAMVPSALLERLNPVEAQLVTGIAAVATPPAPAGECVKAIRKLRLERELAVVQREIDHRQEMSGNDHAEITSLWEKKRRLLRQIESLTKKAS